MAGCSRAEWARRGWRGLVLWFLMGVCLTLGGCKSELYTGLAETQANQMLAVLLASGIAAQKVQAGKEGFAIQVSDRDVLRSLALLESRGLPPVNHTSINEVFQKSGIMSSPFEEKVRYISTLGDEVARTISFIDGVVAARVHIVQPDQPQLGRPATPASAAVFIKHQTGVDLDFLVPQIRRLVSSAIEGLDYASVSVILTEAVPLKQETGARMSQTVEILPGIEVRDTDAANFWRLLYILGAVMLLLIVAAVAGPLLIWRWNRRQRPSDVETAGFTGQDA
ncbi:type III secretion system inner membrane ring lipoprotein SctJ [Pseudochelatococcus sp. B33]